MFDFLKRFATPAQLREAGVLGMNRRNYEIIAKSNDRRLYPLVDDKVQTKKLAAGVGINTPHLIGVIDVQNEVDNFLSRAITNSSSSRRTAAAAKVCWWLKAMMPSVLLPLRKRF